MVDRINMVGPERVIASLEIPSGVNLIGCQLVSPLSKKAAIEAAYASSPVGNNIVWWELFNGLEAAGFIRFEGEE